MATRFIFNFLMLCKLQRSVKWQGYFGRWKGYLDLLHFPSTCSRTFMMAPYPALFTMYPVASQYIIIFTPLYMTIIHKHVMIIYVPQFWPLHGLLSNLKINHHYNSSCVSATSQLTLRCWSTLRFLFICIIRYHYSTIFRTHMKSVWNIMDLFLWTKNTWRSNCETKVRKAYKMLLWKHERKRPPNDLGADGRMLRLISGKKITWWRMDSSGSGYRPVAGSRVHSNETSGAVRDRKRHDQLSQLYPLK